MEEERKKTDNDMQYMDTKLSLVDDSTVMKKFIASQLEALRMQLTELISAEGAKVEPKIAKAAEKIMRVKGVTPSPVDLHEFLRTLPPMINSIPVSMEEAN